MRIEEGFQQKEPLLTHPFRDDSVLQSLVRRLFPHNDRVTQELTRLGNDLNGYIRELGTRVSPPSLIQYNHFGRRVDRLETSEGWRGLKQVAAREGIVATGYERTYGELSRVLMFMKIYMWNADSYGVSCPVAMTDGAAWVIELIGTGHMREHLLPRLLSRDPNLAFTAGQWMTERPGGSDVSRTETTATPVHDTPILENGAPYLLSGIKWFSSATDGQLALALAQLPSLGLGLFLVPLPHVDLALFTPDARQLPLRPHNGIHIHRLKRKIGTHALPTAELVLEHTLGFLLVPPSEGVMRPNGVRAIAPVLNITRVHSAASSAGHLARCLAMAAAYARVRHVAKQQVLLSEVPMHTATLARVEVLSRALTYFLFGVVRLLGRVETGRGTDGERRRLRFLTPVLKAFAAERAVGGMEECMASLGGLGYMEESGLGRLIRDSLVEKMWEGTTNVLALDMLRVAREDGGGSVRAFCEWSEGIVRRWQGHTDGVIRALRWLRGMSAEERVARPALVVVAHIASTTYLMEHASWSKAPVDRVVTERWMDEGGLAEATRDVERIGDEGWDREIVHGAKL